MLFYGKDLLAALDNCRPYPSGEAAALPMTKDAARTAAKRSIAYNP